MAQNTCISMESFFAMARLGKKLAAWWPTRGAYSSKNNINISEAKHEAIGHK